MSKRDLTQLQRQLQKLRDDVPIIMEKLAAEEGLYAKNQARKICKEDNIVNTGNYRQNFKSGLKALRKGANYTIDVYNNLDYAKHLEYGFRSHFVPGHWEGNTFVYQKNDPLGGMYVGPVGGYVPGHYTLRRAVKRTMVSQDVRLSRKMDAILNEYLGDE